MVSGQDNLADNWGIGQEQSEMEYSMHANAKHRENIFSQTY